MSFVRGGRPGQDRSPSHPLLMPRRMLRALQHLDAVDTPVSALDRRGRNADRSHASPHNVTQSLTRRQPLRRGGGEACGFRAGLPLGLRGATVVHAASIDAVVREGRPGRHVPAAGNPAATTDDESYHGSTSELPPATSHGYAEWDFPACRTQ
jgi:hypothetical protein